MQGLPEAPSPRLEVLSIFHRDRRARISFQYDPIGNSSIDVGRTVREPAETHRYRGTVPVALITNSDGWIPEIREHFLQQLGHDGFASINSVGRRTFPRTEDVRRLNAAWVDCDCEELDFEDAHDLLLRLEAQQLFPPISLIERSGRGLRAYWLLKQASKKTNLPPSSRGNNGFLLRQINQELVQQIQRACPALRPDPDGGPLTAHQRIEGSINTRVGLHVEYYQRRTGDGEPPRYTLPQLLKFFGLKSTRSKGRFPPFRNASKTSQQGQKTPGRKNGLIARNAGLWDEFQKIRQHRPHGFLKGTRRHACHLAATFLERMEKPRDDIRREVLRIARECSPPLTSAEALSEYRSGLKPRRSVSYKTVARKLGVTFGEADALSLERIRPDYQAPPRRHTGKQAPARETRHAFLRNLAAKHGKPLPFTYREMENLMQEAGIKTSAGTIRNDLDSLSLSVNKSRADCSSKGELALNLPRA